jgi:hypothetical protein
MSENRHAEQTSEEERSQSFCFEKIHIENSINYERVRIYTHLRHFWIPRML